jgi:Protein of unknown function (DUF3349)
VHPTPPRVIAKYWGWSGRASITGFDWALSSIGCAPAIPRGFRSGDYVPLLALLARRLTAEEVAAVAAKLRDEGKLPASNVDIGELIMGVTDELPRQEAVARVRGQLALGGWPLADPHSASERPDNL